MLLTYDRITDEEVVIGSPSHNAQHNISYMSYLNPLMSIKNIKYFVLC